MFNHFHSISILELVDTSALTFRLALVAVFAFYEYLLLVAKMQSLGSQISTLPLLKSDRRRILSYEFQLSTWYLLHRKSLPDDVTNGSLMTKVATALSD